MITARTKELRKRSKVHIFHEMTVPSNEPQLIFEKGKGIILTDTDGKDYMDICSCLQCASLGYGQKKLIDAAYEQMNKLSYMCILGGYSNIPAIEYAEALAEFTPKNINHFSFTSLGSAAVEMALKYATAYWYFQGKANKLKIICLMEAYHGATGFVSGLMTDSHLRLPGGPDAPGIVHIPNYNCYRCPLGLKYPDCGIRCAKFLERVIEAEAEDSIAAFIAEPAHGYSGAIAPPPEYWPIVREICTKRHVLLIADEVITGFCRTGKNFAVDNWNVQPDLMTMGKGITGVHFPFAAVGVSDKVYATLANHFIVQGFTNPGHPVGCAVAKAALDIYIKDKVADHVTKVGNHIRERFEKEFLPLPNVGYAGGLGLLQAIEIVADKDTKRRFPPEVDVMRNVVLRQCLERGLHTRIFTGTLHDRMAFTPPLIITEEEADKALDILYPILAGLKDLKVK